MAGELINMKVMSRVRVDLITINPVNKVFTVDYAIVDAAGGLLYAESVHKDLSKVPNIGAYTLAQMNDWAIGAAVTDAEDKYGV